MFPIIRVNKLLYERSPITVRFVIILVNYNRKYADSVNDKLHKELFGITSLTKYMNKGAPGEDGKDTDEILVSTELIRDALERNLLFVLLINQSSEQYNSVNLIVLNKWRLNATNKNSANVKKTSHTIKGISHKVLYFFLSL